MINVRNVLAAVAVSLLPTSAFAETTVLKLGFFGPDTEVNYKEVLKPWADAVNADSSGALRIETYPNGALGKALPEQPQLVLDGVLDIAFVNTALVPGRFPDDQLFELPALFSGAKEGLSLYAELTRRGKLRGYQDYHVIGTWVNFDNTIFSRKAVTEPGQIEGLKIRINGAIVGQTIKEFRGVPVLMPPDQVVEAMGRGTIDAAISVPAAAIDFGINRVTPYAYKMPLGTNAFAVLMNSTKYAALPDDAKAVLDKYSMDWINDLYLEKTVPFDEAASAQLDAEPKRTVTEPSEADVAKMRPVFDKVREAWLAKDPANAALLDEVTAILTEIRKK